MIHLKKIRFTEIRLSLHAVILIFSIWLTLSCNFIFFNRLYELTPYMGLPAQLFIVAMFIVLVAYFNFVFNLLMWRSTAKILVCVFLFFGASASYFNFLGIGIDALQIQNLLETDPKEVADLMSIQTLIWAVIFFIVPCIFFTQIKIKDVKLSERLKSKLFMSVVSLLTMFILVFIYYADLAAIFRENRNLKGFISPQNVFASSLSYYKTLAPKQNIPLQAYGRDAVLMSKANVQQPKLLILVVGETARAESFSLNGYTKNTNPELAQLPIINFTQVSSCGTATAVSVPCMFSGMPRDSYDQQVAKNRENLLDILQKSRYHVTWMDNNSGCKDVCNRVQQYEFPQQLRDKWCKDGECLDEILVDGLQDYLSHIAEQDLQSRVVILHQMGSHGPAYYKRSTTQFQPFQPFCATNAIQGCSTNELINAYDNSIVYTDHVLAKTIKTLDTNTKYQTAFWYLSDHGESTGEHGLYLHGAPYMIAPTQQTHVPMMMWFSNHWKSTHQDQMKCLSQQRNQQLSQDHLFATMLSLLDVRTSVKYPKFDLLSMCSKAIG